MARNRDDSAIVKKAWITRKKNMGSKAGKAAAATAAARAAGVKVSAPKPMPKKRPPAEAKKRKAKRAASRKAVVDQLTALDRGAAARRAGSKIRKSKGKFTVESGTNVQKSRAFKKVQKAVGEKFPVSKGFRPKGPGKNRDDARERADQRAKKRKASFGSGKGAREKMIQASKDVRALEKKVSALQDGRASKARITAAQKKVTQAKAALDMSRRTSDRVDRSKIKQAGSSGRTSVKSKKPMTQNQAIKALRSEGFPVDGNPDLMDSLHSTSPKMRGKSSKMQARYWELRRGGTAKPFKQTEAQKKASAAQASKTKGLEKQADKRRNAASRKPGMTPAQMKKSRAAKARKEAIQDTKVSKYRVAKKEPKFPVKNKIERGPDNKKLIKAFDVLSDAEQALDVAQRKLNAVRKSKKSRAAQARATNTAMNHVEAAKQSVARKKKAADAIQKDIKRAEREYTNVPPTSNKRKSSIKIKPGSVYAKQGAKGKLRGIKEREGFPLPRNTPHMNRIQKDPIKSKVRAAASDKQLKAGYKLLKTQQANMDYASRRMAEARKLGVSTAKGKAMMNRARNDMSEAEQKYGVLENKIIQREREMGRNPKRRTSVSKAQRGRVTAKKGSPVAKKKHRVSKVQKAGKAKAPKAPRNPATSARETPSQSKMRTRHSAVAKRLADRLDREQAKAKTQRGKDAALARYKRDWGAAKKRNREESASSKASRQRRKTKK